MEYANILDESIKKKINSMPKESEIMPLGNLEDKMNQLVNCVDRMTSQKNNDIHTLNNIKEKRKDKELALKQIKDEIRQLESKQNTLIIELEKDKKELRFKNMHKTKNTKANVDNDSVQNDIAKICDEIKQILEEIQAYGDYTIAITPEIKQKKNSIEIIKKENKEMTNEIKFLLDKEKRSILDVKRIIDQINFQEAESQRFLQSIEQKVKTAKPGITTCILNGNNNANNNNNNNNDEEEDSELNESNYDKA